MTVRRTPREPDVKATAELLFGIEMKMDCPVCDGKGCSECGDQGRISLLPEDYR